MELQQLAGICHEANRALCRAVSDPAPEQESWERTPDIIRDSVIMVVRFRLNNPNADPSKSHEEWLKYKEAEGWMYGEVKDIEAKTHPNMVHFNDLPVEQQAKDFLFAAIVESLAPLVDEPDEESKDDSPDLESGD